MASMEVSHARRRRLRVCVPLKYNNSRCVSTESYVSDAWYPRNGAAAAAASLLSHDVESFCISLPPPPFRSGPLLGYFLIVWR